MAYVYKPSLEDMAETRAEAMNNGATSPQAWLSRILGTIRDIIANDPRRYRAFGPYWWLVKLAMLNHDIDEFGETIDAQRFEQFDYGNDVDNILASFIYFQWATSRGMIYSQGHQIIELQDDGEGEPNVQEYVLIDDEVEMLAFK